MAASITRVVGMSNRNRGDGLSQSGIILAGASVAVIGCALEVDGTERCGVELLGAHQMRHQGRGVVDWLSGNRGTDSLSMIAY